MSLFIDQSIVKSQIIFQVAVDFLLGASNVLMHADDIARALMYARRAMALAGDTPSVIGPTTIAARCLYILGHHHQTLHLVEQGLDAADRYGLDKGRNHILLLLARAMVLEDWGRTMEALKDLKYAYTIMKDAEGNGGALGDDRRLRSNLLSKLAGAYESAGMMAEAVAVDNEQLKEVGIITSSSSACRFSTFLLSEGEFGKAEENLRMQVAAMESRDYLPCSSDQRVLGLLVVCLEVRGGERALEEAMHVRAMAESKGKVVEERRAALLEETKSQVVAEKNDNNKENINGPDGGIDGSDGHRYDGSVEAALSGLSMSCPTLGSNQQAAISQCPVCLQEEQEVMMVVLVCGHRYHGRCLDLWASKCREDGITRSCPTCCGPMTRV